MHQRVSKVVLHTGLNVYRESSGDSRFLSKCVPNTNSKRVYYCDIKNKEIYHFLMLKKNSKFTSFVNFIPYKFSILSQWVSKVTPHTGLIA